MRDTTPDLAVVVPTHDRRDLVLEVVRSLRAQTLDPARFEIVVVCDGCEDGTAETLRALERSAPRLTVLEQERSGAATARNCGAAAARAPIVVFLDDDMIADPGCLDAHLAVHATHSEALVLGAMPVHPGSPRSFLTVGLARWADRRDAALAVASDVPWDEVLTGHLSLPRTVLDALGRFDTSFTAGGGFGGEDIEFGWRAKVAGVRLVYEPCAVSRQVFRKTFAGLVRNIREAAAADVRLARKHPGAAARLTLGRIAELPPWERRALRLTLAAPLPMRLAFVPVLALLGAAARHGAVGKRWEHLHAIARAHLYALGLRDAGWRVTRPGRSPTGP